MRFSHVSNEPLDESLPNFGVRVPSYARKLYYSLSVFPSQLQKFIFGLPMGRPPHALFASFERTTGRIAPKLWSQTPTMCPQVVLEFECVSMSTAKVYFLPPHGEPPHGEGRPPHALFACFSRTTGRITPKLGGQTPTSCPQVVLTFWRVSMSAAKVHFLPPHGEGQSFFLFLLGHNQMTSEPGNCSCSLASYVEANVRTTHLVCGITGRSKTRFSRVPKFTQVIFSIFQCTIKLFFKNSCGQLVLYTIRVGAVRYSPHSKEHSSFGQLSSTRVSSRWYVS